MRRLILAATLACVFGCSPTIVRPPAETDRALRGTSASDLVDALEVSQKALRSIDALGKISVSTPDDRLHASQVVLARAPDAFRIEVIAPFGISYAVASNGKTIAALSTRENLIYRGAPDSRTVADVIGIALDPRDMTNLLLGRPPVSARSLASLWTSNRPVEDASAEVGTPTVFLHGADGHDTSVVIGFDRLQARGEHRTVPVSFQRIARNGQQLLRATFEDFIVEDQALIPRRIRIHAASTNAVVTYREVIANKPMPAKVFEIDTPAGTREITLRHAKR